MTRPFRPDLTLFVLASLGPLFWAAYYLYIRPVIEPGWPAQAPLRFGLLVLVYPVLEEIVFRGLVQEGVGRVVHARFGLLSLANVMTSVLFAALHLIHQNLFWSLLIFLPSLLFGFAKERYGNLLAPILLHCWYNLGFIWLFRPF